MAALPKPSAILTWIIYLVPLYIFVLAPLLRQLFPARGDEDLDEREQHRQHAPGVNVSDDSFISAEDGTPLDCAGGADNYQVHLLSRDPLVIYIEGFVKDSEADHLLNVSLGRYTPSTVYDGTAERVDQSTRLSDRALLERDSVVRCLEERARSFQGWRPHLYIERMWAQRYNASGHYRHHYDWAGTAAYGGDRVSTFMVYLGANCTGGGTHFPRMKRPPGEKWCQLLECEEQPPTEKDATETTGASGDDRGRRTGGITFKPIKGNAVFWENLRADGTGYPETWHAALPVTSGTKVGLNIWSWYQPPRPQGSARRRSRPKQGRQ